MTLRRDIHNENNVHIHDFNHVKNAVDFISPINTLKDERFVRNMPLPANVNEVKVIEQEIIKNSLNQRKTVFDQPDSESMPY